MLANMISNNNAYLKRTYSNRFPDSTYEPPKYAPNKPNFEEDQRLLKESYEAWLSVPDRNVLSLMVPQAVTIFQGSPNMLKSYAGECF